MSLVTVAEAVERLRAGDVVALPTETVYGLAARIDSEPALLKIFAAKQRPSFDPLIVHVGDVASARILSAYWPEVYDALAAEFWPGPLTLIAPKREAVSMTITSGLTTVALRCPMHPVFLQAIQKVGVPLAAPSANRFGRTSPTTAEHVQSEFGGAVAIVDGGPCSVGVESTVLSAERVPAENRSAAELINRDTASEKWLIKILRPGGVSREQINTFLSRRGFNFEIKRESSMASPGNLKAHYQPESPIVILTRPWSAELRAEAEAQLKRKVLGYTELTLPATPQEAARTLYAEFRRLSKTPDHLLLIYRHAEHSGPDWEAVWDRIERASSLTL